MISSAPSAGQAVAASARESAQHRDTKLMLVGIVAFGAVLRLVALNAKSFWLDEIASVVIARMSGNSFWHWLWIEEGNMALYYVMLRPWLGIHFGEGTVRLLSVLPGIASVPVMYLLGARLFGRSLGLLAALLLALSNCSVVYSQEARGYSWLLLGVIVSTYFFTRLIERPTYAMACAYALAAGVTFYFHYFGLLVPLAHAVSLIALPKARRPWKQLLAAAVLLAVLAAPVLWMVRTQPARHLDWVQKPSLLELYHLGVFLAAESGKGVGPALLVLELVLLGMFFRQLFALGREQRSGCDLWPYALVASGLLTPMVFTLLVSVVRPVFFHRFLIICLPAWLLAVAVGVSALIPRRTRNLAIAGVCALSLASTVMSYSREREDWRGVANYLIMNATAQDRVVYYQGVGNFASESYRDWLPGGSANRPGAVEVSPQSNEWLAKISSARRVWLVQYPASLSDDTLRRVEAELHRRYSPGASQQFRAVTVTEFVAKQ
jgi:uncharacterized membrane protein